MKKWMLLAALIVGARALTQAETWTMAESGEPPRSTTYRLEPGSPSVLTSQRPHRMVVTVFEPGQTLRWTRQGDQGEPLELVRVGQEFLVRRGTETTRFGAGDLPWIQDLNLLSSFVRGPETKLRFSAFADFLDRRFQASDLTTFVATKVTKEVQTWGTGTGETWKVRVTFDDFRSAFWGAWYWFRVSDGRLVRSEEVRGGPGTPVTVSVLATEEP